MSFTREEKVELLMMFESRLFMLFERVFNERLNEERKQEHFERTQHKYSKMHDSSLDLQFRFLFNLDHLSKEEYEKKVAMYKELLNVNRK